MLVEMMDKQKVSLMVAGMAETKVAMKVKKMVVMMAGKLEHLTAAAMARPKELYLAA